MEAWRRVEVAACEEMPGPDARRPRGDPRGDVHRRRRQGARAGHRPRRRGLRRRAQRERGPVRALDPLRPDVAPTCSTPRSPCRSARRARSSSPARAGSSRRWRSARASTSRPSASGARTASRPSRRRSASSSPASPSRPSATPQRLQEAFAQASVGALSGAVGTYSATDPDFEARVLARLGLARRGGLDPGRPARPSRRADAGHRARRRRPRAARHRDPPSAAHRGPRGRGAVPLRAAEGLERDAPQAQPDRERAHLRPGAGAARQRPGGRRERRAVARARHLALGRRARDPARRDDPARLHAAPRDARRARPRRAPRTACARTST